jgi:hypothetical protein
MVNRPVNAFNYCMVNRHVNAFNYLMVYVEVGGILGPCDD